jgi:hypothetical protein
MKVHPIAGAGYGRCNLARRMLAVNPIKSMEEINFFDVRRGRERNIS